DYEPFLTEEDLPPPHPSLSTPGAGELPSRDELMRRLQTAEANVRFLDGLLTTTQNAARTAATPTPNPARDQRWTDVAAGIPIYNGEDRLQGDRWLQMLVDRFPADTPLFEYRLQAAAKCSTGKVHEVVGVAAFLEWARFERHFRSHFNPDIARRIVRQEIARGVRYGKLTITAAILRARDDWETLAEPGHSKPLEDQIIEALVRIFPSTVVRREKVGLGGPLSFEASLDALQTAYDQDCLRSDKESEWTRAGHNQAYATCAAAAPAVPEPEPEPEAHWAPARQPQQPQQPQQSQQSQQQQRKPRGRKGKGKSKRDDDEEAVPFTENQMSQFAEFLFKKYARRPF
ncbi:hypothetical protein IWQ57_005719, partial [Coemansia nantahalensis]